MADPTTANKLLLAPNRGADAGTWDVPVNSDWSAIDGMLGGSLLISLAGTTGYTLGGPTGSVSPAAGPTQAQNAMITFSGTLTANCVVAVPLPGFYIVNNQCVGSTVILSVPGATGTDQLIGLPPGQKIHVFCDGSNQFFVDQPPVGTFMDLCVQSIPTWIQQCTVYPWLVCDGGIYSTSAFTTLGTMLGSTFGGNGITTFAVPDLRARYRIPLDNQGGQGAAGRITAALSGVNGTTIGASGGQQATAIAQANLPVTPPAFTGNSLVGAATWGGNTASGGSGGATVPAANNMTSTTFTVTGAIAGGSGTPLITLPPGLVFGMTFIKT